MQATETRPPLKSVSPQEPSKGKIAELAKMTSLVEQLTARVELLEEARRLQGNLPRDVRERLESKSFDDERLHISMAFMTINPVVLDGFLDSTRDMLQFAQGLAGEIANESNLREEDLECVGLFVKLLRRFKPRSKQQLIQFLGAVRHEQQGYAVLKTDNNGSEVRFRYRCPDDMLDWFEHDRPV